MPELYLPLTVSVESIVVCALRQLKELDGLDRDEAYLLARLERADDPTGALIEAIEDAPYD